jgi:DNA-binding IclR family transcriptional regulator
LRLTRERGFALSEQEYELNINAVSAPILDGRGHPQAAVAIAGPSFRMTHERLLALGPEVRAAADAIARDMGYSVAIMAPAMQFGN